MEDKTLSARQKSQILQELRQLRQVESHLQARFETLGTAKPEARWSFLDSLEEWRMRAQALDNLLEHQTL
jgi:hypothetical protein